jgi:hypothetical protein
MARYQDYVKDDIQEEIVEAAEEAVTRQEEPQEGFSMPDRFVGKSSADIAKAYTELETLNSRQAQDLGTMRRNVDEMINLQSQTSRPTEEAPILDAEPVTVDDLYEDIEGTISRVAGKASNSRLEALEKELANTKAEAKLNELSVSYPDWQTEVKSPEFQNWVNESPYRQRLAQAADSYDFDAADTLFGIYNDLKGSKRKVDTAERDQALRDATLESSGAPVPDMEEEFSRANLMQARIAAKRGSSTARQWLNDNSAGIAKAYEDGHITD